jgi:uncharacterized protein with HEPN domain
MANDDKHRLAEIIELIDLIRDHLARCSRSEFAKDRHRIDATAYRLQAIGEATIRLSDDLKLLYQDIQWADIRDMRHILSHHYGKVDPAIIWAVYTEHLDTLYDACVDAAGKI